jgi:hypothetical protein
MFTLERQPGVKFAKGFLDAILEAVALAQPNGRKLRRARREGNAVVAVLGGECWYLRYEVS